MEFVLVVPRTELFPRFAPHGFVAFGPDFAEERLWECIDRHGHFVERDYAERTPTLKQVIPYSVVARRSTPSGGEVLCLRRTRRGGEARLHDKLSIGVGGHVNPIDALSSTSAPPSGSRAPARPADARGDGGGKVAEAARRRDCVIAATRREVVEEELELSGRWSAAPVGLLNDDSNAVGAVHVGLVQVVTVDGPVAVREIDQLEGSFATLDGLRERLARGANFETWSSLLIPHLDRLVPQPSRAVHPLCLDGREIT